MALWGGWERGSLAATCSIPVVQYQKALGAIVRLADTFLTDVGALLTDELAVDTLEAYTLEAGTSESNALRVITSSADILEAVTLEADTSEGDTSEASTHSNSRA